MPNEQGQGSEQQQAANSGGESGTYTPPASQADLDRIITDRISRERGKYADYEDLKAKASKFDEAEAANQSELQKAAKRAEDAEAKVAAHEAARKVDEWKKDVSKDRPDLRDLLTATSEADLRAQFDALSARIPAPSADTSSKDDGKPHIPYRELSKAQAEAPEPTTASGRLRAAYANSESKK
jgi:DNA mismatch repair ATPase MutS